MTEPTLSELREMATHLHNLARDELAEYEFEDHDDPDLRSHIESRIAVLQSYLALTDQIAAVTAERDAAMRNCSDAFDAVIKIRAERDALLSHVESVESDRNRVCGELHLLRQRLAEAPEVDASIYADGSLAHVEKWWPRDDAPFVGAVRVRLVRDDTQE